MADVLTWEEKQNKKKAMAITAGLVILLFLAIFFLVAWRPADPPPPGVGFELNFGTTTTGTGDVETFKPVTAQEPQQEPVQEQTSESTPETTPQISDEVPQSQLEDVAPDKKEKKEEKKAPIKKPEEKKEPEKPKPKIQYTPHSDGQSQGDDKNASGNKGDPKGLDPKGQWSGTPGKGDAGSGGAGGPSLSLRGWEWDEIPRPTPPKNESGILKFEIRVDSNGEVIGYKVLEQGVSSETVRIYSEAIQRLTFTKEPGASVPAISVGTITFVIKSR